MGLALVILSAGPALAFCVGPHSGTLTVWCTPDKGVGVQIDGTLTVPAGSNGDVNLVLYASKGPNNWHFSGLWDVIHVVKGQTTYSFSFDSTLDATHFNEYKVAGDGTWSRIINRDECGFRVPEAPSSALLLLGALPVFGVVGMRVTGIRVPRPSWRRVA
jgi:hypothetical protein